MDKVFIKNLEIDTIIGIYDVERTRKQKVVFDLELSWDVLKVAKSGSIDDALNYKTLSDHLKEFVGQSRCELIETLAEQIAHLVLEEYAVPTVSLTLHKPDALDGDTDVGVKIVRHSQSDKLRPGFLL